MEHRNKLGTFGLQRAMSEHNRILLNDTRDAKRNLHDHVFLLTPRQSTHPNLLARLGYRVQVEMWE